MRIIISGGGTGGHIYPALAVLNKLKEQDPDVEILYVGGERGLEGKIVPDAGYKFASVEVQGFKRSLSADNFKTIYLFLKAVRAAQKIVREFKPDVVVGTGGYVSGPVVYAAQRLGVPTVIHEQNSVIGVTNKFLARKITKVGVAFAEALKAFKPGSAEVVGNPRAQEVVEAQGAFDWNGIGLDETQPTVLVFGGSQGALKLNRAMIDATESFSKKDYQVIFVTGGKRYDDVVNTMATEKISPAKNMAVVPYISNMPQLMPKVDLIVGRAGATSIAEQTALGKPMVLIPSPYVTNDHQTKNAQALVDAGAAALITEPNLTGRYLFDVVNNLMQDRNKRVTMAAAAKKIGVPDAADRFVELIKSVIKK
ncbi:undecaprenyldiphospho-muramoylpentapeptide beta-N-acetylglucosaminyltransferase [Weissella muntiaci]|uniref:UDP-N-acetylglucosamine--N-acetylmuramyl-(pentapeptide) pyrophosphoryl-undecaprenol N-acetylglucosamine transferase n=1 Tax=Weissella muntiaci TaxID=2508881 RepID=A0A6C2C964_9LACO|nr:undecaprenyldiphospho-muramoylpentapeptide beta-N-acetylglucosaminyltransferase [Weissella muntiaci]TYC50129.1 undecaprenyldiphospho-muramoylpentapeptide beta-N-acetylglucosaminyltransferase [Weissella muntiaci]